MCERFVQSSFDNMNLIGYKSVEKILIKKIPYVFQADIVLDTKVFPEIRGYMPTMTITFPNDSPGTVSPDTIPDLTGKDHCCLIFPIEYTIGQTGFLDIQISWGTIIYSRRFEFAIGNSPYRLNVSNSYLGGILGTAKANTDIRDLLSQTVNKLVIIDQYLPPDELLHILEKTNSKASIQVLTNQNQKTNYLSMINDIKKQYPSLEVRFSKTFHDRFVIRDDEEIFAFGYSLKDLTKSRISYYCRIDERTSQTEIIDSFNDGWANASTL
jgi:hypothetical protein